MAASFGEPLILSRHDIPSKSASSISPVVASCSKGIKADYATLGIQDEGITIIDLTTLQPEAAALLGPDSVMHCAPVSRIVEHEREEPLRQTYSVSSTVKDAQSSLHGGTITYWSSKESLSSLETVSSITLEEPIVSIFAPEWMPDTVIAVSPNSAITLCDAKLKQATSHTAPSTTKKHLFSFLFDAAACQFFSSPAASENQAILLSILKDGHSTYLRRSVIGSSTQPEPEIHLPLPKLNLYSASCDKDGCLTLLGDDGVLFSFLVESHQGTLMATAMEKLPLQNLEISSTTLLCLGSTHVLVIGVTKDDSDIAMLLWDVKYSVILTQRRITIPSNLTSIPPNQLLLQAIPCNESQSILLIYPSTSRARSKSSTTGLKSMAMILPHIVPPTSSLANAIGKASSAETWLKSSDAQGLEVNGIDEDRKDVLQRMAEAFQNGTAEDSDRVFFGWLDEQRSIAKAAAKEEAKRQLAALHGSTKQINGKPSKDESSDSDGKATRHDSRAHIKHIPTQVQFGHVFLIRLLEAVFQPAGLQPGKYSSKIPTYLLERKLISDSMFEGGVLKALQDRNDWESIRWALRNTVDIPEDQLVSLLRYTADLQAAKAADAMDVDDSTSKAPTTLTPSQVLGHVVAYPTSAPPLRLALRQHFSRAEDALTLLNVLNEWINAAGKQSTSIKLGNIEEAVKEDTSMNKGLSKKGTPRLDMVINFLSCLLDATLLELLQYRPAHDLLRSMSERTSLQISYLDDLEKLCGPLEPFAQIDKRGKKSKDDKKQQKRHEIKPQSHALAVDLYDIEEFLL